MVNAMKDRLYRSRINRYLGGVSAGMGEYFSIDPIIVRVLFIILTLTSLGFGGILLYIVLWIVIPEEPYHYYKEKTQGTEEKQQESPKEDATGVGTESTAKKSSYQKASQGQMLVGIILICLGTIFLVGRIFPSMDFDLLLPFALVAIGAAIVFSSVKK